MDNSSRDHSAERMEEDTDRVVGSRSRSRSRSVTPRRSVSGERRYKSRSRSVSRSRSPPPRRSRSRSPPPRRSRSRSPPARRSRRGRSRSFSRSRSRSVSPRRYRRNSPPRRRRFSRSPSRSRSPPRRSGSHRSSSRKEFHGTREQPEMSNILGVFGLNMHTRERDLEDVFGKFGPLEKVTVVYDHRAKRSRGFAFVNFTNQEDATRARAETNGVEIDGRRVRVDYSVTHRPHSPTPGEYMGEKRPNNYDRRHDGRHDGRRHRYYRSRSPPRRRRSRSRSWSR
ncbi:hypothetical protein BJ944DRAFT_268039 [Cunninghamella echinulata]|nr:hypothetical protein BJ944DRAFT_268039 [Cunninghamella echinulata]